MAILSAVLEDQPLIVDDEDVPASKPDKGTTTPPKLVKSGLCMQFFKHKPCQYGDLCKNHHLTLDQLLEQKLSLKDEDEPVEEKAKIAVASKSVEKMIEEDLYKTKLCTPYQEGKCKRGFACSYVHITGPDAKRIMALANTNKACPFEEHLGVCPQRICFFKHDKRQSTSVWKFGTAYQKRHECFGKGQTAEQQWCHRDRDRSIEAIRAAVRK